MFSVYISDSDDVKDTSEFIQMSQNLASGRSCMSEKLNINIDGIFLATCIKAVGRQLIDLFRY